MLRTPLFDEHQAMGAAFTDFGGWEMPVRYGSDLDEHHAVRNSAGLFDISHMGEIRIKGEAAELLDYALVSKLMRFCSLSYLLVGVLSMPHLIGTLNICPVIPLR